MVMEARKKSGQCLDAAFLALGHLAVVTGMPMNIAGLGTQATGKVTPPIKWQQLLSVDAPGSNVFKPLLHHARKSSISCEDLRASKILRGGELMI